VPHQPAATGFSSAPVRGAALRSALRAAAAGLSSSSRVAFRPVQAGGGGTAELLQAPIVPAPRGIARSILVVRGSVPWTGLHSELVALEAVSSGRWAVEDLVLDSLITRPSWAGERGFACEQAALDASREILRRNPAVVVLAPGLRASRSGHLRSAAWPRGSAELPMRKRLELHSDDVAWMAVAGVLDAIIEVTAADVPAPAFALLMPEAFSTASGRLRLEPFYEAHLDALAGLSGVSTGALYQCAWGSQAQAAVPLRFISNIPALLDGCYPGPPVRRAARGSDGGKRFAYHGPLPSSCECGSAHQRRSTDEALAAEPAEAGTSRRLAQRLGVFLGQQAARPLALFGGESAALTLLEGPPSRGPPVSGRSRGGEKGWRPLDQYVGRNDRYGATTWGNPFKVGRDGDAGACCRAFEDWLRKNGVLWARLKELKGRRLRCHCASEAPCHADVLVRLFCESSREEGGVVRAAAPGNCLGPVAAAVPGVPWDPVASSVPGNLQVPVVAADPGSTRDPVASTVPGNLQVPVVATDLGLSSGPAAASMSPTSGTRPGGGRPAAREPAPGTRSSSVEISGWTGHSAARFTGP